MIVAITLTVLKKNNEGVLNYHAYTGSMPISKGLNDVQTPIEGFTQDMINAYVYPNNGDQLISVSQLLLP